MRVVLDTNILVSGLLWDGPPRRILIATRRGILELYISPSLISELREVLNRPKFNARLQAAHTSVTQLIDGITALATVVQPADIPTTVHADPDDDEVLACAIAASASFIVSGDEHLLLLGNFREIRIVKAIDLLSILEQIGE